MGLAAGSSFTVGITLRVPDDYPPGTSDDIVNTATVTADNADPKSDDATVNIDSPVIVDVAVDKSWDPPQQTYEEGVASTIGVDAVNTSNAPVDTIVIQEPTEAQDGAATLDPSNPFTITDFTGFTGGQLPEGCDELQIDAYVLRAGSWVWVEGDPQPASGPPDLPVGVSNADVGGIRVTCTGQMAPAETLSVDVGLMQRATDRNDGSDLSAEIQTVDNTATGSVAYGDQTATGEGMASHTVNPLIPNVEAQKNISPGRITAGQSSTATITGTNGDTEITELSVADLDFFTTEVTFGGFDGPLTWPANATSATITYYDLGGNPVTPVESVTEGRTPAGPSGDISGFEIVYAGTIEPAESGGATFTIDTSEDTAVGQSEVDLTNTVDVVATAQNGLIDDASAQDDLQIVDPSIEVSLDKAVRPSAGVEPGDTVIASLESTTTATGDGTLVDTIAVEDAWTGDCGGFWNGFDLDSIAPTQVPADTELTVEVQDTGGTWHQIALYGPQANATVFQMSRAETTAALSAQGLSRDDVVGIRFTFTNTEGFPADTSVTPNVVYSARSDLREGSCTDPAPDSQVTYTNSASTVAEGETDGGKDLTDEDTDTATGTVFYPSGGPRTGPEITKNWDRVAVDSQSSERPVTHLDWNLEEGLSPVRITDTAGDPSLAQVPDSVFDAFDLIQVQPIAASDEAYSSGWYLKYDTVTAIEVYDGDTGTWVTVPAPAGTWMTTDRGFKGYSLTADEQSSTTGVRITLAETERDITARSDARQAGPDFDPFAPEPGSGVGAGSAERRFDLTWQIRDTKRSDGSFVIGDETFNTADPGVVDNSVQVRGTPIEPGPDLIDTDDDPIQILDPDPLVAVTKDVAPTQNIYTPPVGSPPSEYPTVTWSIGGHNASTARASYVRLTDPATCNDTTLAACQSEGTPSAAVANPFDTSGGTDYLGDPAVPNPFERFDATSITIGATIPAQIDLDATTVWLLRYSAGTYTTEETTAASVNELGAAGLTDVVGISVTFQDTDPATTGGTMTQNNDLTIVIDSVLRPSYRSTGDALLLAAGETFDQTNRVFAQSYDPVTSSGEVNGDVNDATTQLTGGIVNVSPTKAIAPGTITRPMHDADDDQVTVTLGADQGTDPRSTLSPQRLVIEDQADAGEFWDAFTFTGNVTVAQVPAGSDQMRVDLYDGSAWVTGPTTAPASPTLPSVPFSDVQGIRFTFDRADGDLFSDTLPAPNWAAAVTFDADLRDTYRVSGSEVEFPSTVVDTQSSQTLRPDDNDSDVVDATDSVELDPGTHDLSVNKLTNEGERQVSVGDDVPFDLTLENTGTGYLTLTELRDALPPELLYTGDPEPEYSADPDGTLSEDVTITPSADGTELVFTWPDGGNVMLPGETFVIRLYLELEPGLGAGETATNTMVAATEEELDSCSNMVAGGTTTDDWVDDPTTCGTTDFVQTVVGPNLYTLKGVAGSLPGAYVPTDSEAVCNANLSVGGESYYRDPCVANSQVGGVDDWVLNNVNAGTVNLDEMTIFDQLPVPGDQQLVSGNSRGSVYRPQMVADSLAVDAPVGTTETIEVTTSPDVCVGTWATIVDQPACEQSGETWVDAGTVTDWSRVTGLRIHLDFTTTTAGALQPGESANVSYSTSNVLESGADPSGSSRVVPAADEYAYNQFGNKFLYTTAPAYRAVAPTRVGVHLQTGSIRIDKEVTGPGSRYAPDEFLVDLTCQVGSGAGAEELDLGDDAVVELNATTGYSVRIDGIPVSAQGTQCTATEQGGVGEFGETSRSGTPTTVDVDLANDPAVPVADQDVPAAQIVAITNDYAFTGLSVTKRVETEAVGTSFGPFRFSISCVSAGGDPVVLAPIGRTRLTFELSENETWNAPANRIPVGAVCTLTETDEYFADHLTITGDNVVDNGDGTATVTPGEDPAEVEFVNAYDAGSFTLAKVADGDGAARYGTGDFVVDVVCTYEDQTPFDGEVVLAAGDSRTLGPYPVRTECVVEETSSVGASTATLEPAEGVVVIPDPTTPDELSEVSMTATNTFDLTSLDVAKVVQGDLQADGAAGPFTVTLECTWLVDGSQQPLDVPGGADRVLRRANKYAASYQDLPSSAECRLAETKSNGAAQTWMIATVNGSSTRSEGTGVDVDLINTDGPGQAAIVVTNRFEAGVVDAEDDSNGSIPNTGSNEDDNNGSIPNTGSNFGPGLLGLAVLLVVIGGGVIYRNRRRT